MLMVMFGNVVINIPNKRTIQLKSRTDKNDFSEEQNIWRNWSFFTTDLEKD